MARTTLSNSGTRTANAWPVKKSDFGAPDQDEEKFDQRVRGADAYESATSGKAEGLICEPLKAVIKP